jgi:hypothetical protein
MEDFRFSATTRSWKNMLGFDYKKGNNDLQPAGPQMTAVEVPVLSNLREYEWLPGHSTVRYIIHEVLSEDSYEPSYLVKLESHELEVVRSQPPQLKML